MKLTVYHYPHIACLKGTFKNLNVFTLSSPYYRGKKLKLGAFRKFHYLINHLVYSLLVYFLPTIRAMWYSCSGVKKP